ncbi:MAG: heme ABC exporter ATP-binding protein CcmA [Candidatus Binatia bacterium]
MDYFHAGPNPVRAVRDRDLHVTVRQLSKAYGFLWALKDLTINVSPGEFIALLGPNGAGKSTFLNLLAGLIRPTLGSIEFNGKDLSRMEEAERSNVGLLAPGEHLYENLTARENLKFFTALYKRARDAREIDTALDHVGLGRRADEYVAAFSSGMKCRLSIAKWRLLEPGLLLLDEPYGVLDGSGVNLLEEFLKNHCDKGRIVVIASHHVSRVLRICSRAIVLHHGRLTFDEPRQYPWDSFTRAFSEFLPQGE